MTNFNKSIIAEIKRETGNTKRMVEVLKDENLGWKPHEKSMSAGKLANHIVQLHNWVGAGLVEDELDLLTVKLDDNSASVEGLINALEENMEKNMKAIEPFSENDWNKLWSLKAGDRVIATMPRSAAFRFLVHNHLIHHRGQLSVYLRLLNIPVPGVYGPSADER